MRHNRLTLVLARFGKHFRPAILVAHDASRANMRRLKIYDHKYSIAIRSLCDPKHRAHSDLIRNNRIRAMQGIDCARWESVATIDSGRFDAPCISSDDMPIVSSQWVFFRYRRIRRLGHCHPSGAICVNRDKSAISLICCHASKSNSRVDAISRIECIFVR